MDKKSRKDALSRKSGEEDLESQFGKEDATPDTDGDAMGGGESSMPTGGAPDMNSILEQLAMAGQSLPPDKQQLVAQALEILSQVTAQPAENPQSGTPPAEGEDLSNMKGGVPSKAQMVG